MRARVLNLEPPTRLSECMEPGCGWTDSWDVKESPQEHTARAKAHYVESGGHPVWIRTETTKIVVRADE